MTESIYIKLRVTPEERDLLDAECARLDVDRSKLLRQLVFTHRRARLSRAPGRAPIDRAIERVKRNYDVPRNQIEPLVCAVVAALDPVTVSG